MEIKDGNKYGNVFTIGSTLRERVEELYSQDKNLNRVGFKSGMIWGEYRNHETDTKVKGEFTKSELWDKDFKPK